MKPEDNTEHRHALIDHPSLQVLMPSLQRYIQKGLDKLSAGDKTFLGSALEIYAENVVARVSELDNAIAALRLTLNFVMDLSAQPAPAADIYRYHYENFVLRVIGFDDRAHRLVGSALLIDKSKLEGVGGNQIVRKQVKNHPDIQAALEEVADAVKSYRGPRNELIHNAAYTSRELGLFQTIQQLGVDTGGIDVHELARKHFSGGAEEIMRTIEQLVDALAHLLSVLKTYLILAVENGEAEREKE